MDLYYKQTLSLKHQFCPILHQTTVCSQIDLLFDSQPLFPGFQLQRHQYFHSVATNHCSSFTEHLYLRVWLKSKAGQARQFLAGNFLEKGSTIDSMAGFDLLSDNCEKRALNSSSVGLGTSISFVRKVFIFFTCICSLTFADRVSYALLNSFCLVFGAVKLISHTGL